MNTAFYQRSRKVMPNHKTEGVGAALQSAFPKARDVIVDGEVVVKAADGTILPFGVQGAKKIKEHVGSTCCLIIFDVLVLNGDDLTKKSLRRRRQILEQARIGQWLQQVDTRASEAQSSPRDHRPQLTTFRTPIRYRIYRTGAAAAAQQGGALVRPPTSRTPGNDSAGCRIQGMLVARPRSERNNS